MALVWLIVPTKAGPSMLVFTLCACFVKGARVVNNLDWYSKLNILDYLRDTALNFRIGTLSPFLLLAMDVDQWA